MVKISYNGKTIDKEFNMYDALELINAAKDANYLVEWITPDPYENAYLWANVKDYK